MVKFGTLLAVGSITSRCSGKELALLPRGPEFFSVTIPENVFPQQVQWVQSVKE